VGRVLPFTALLQNAMEGTDHLAELAQAPSFIISEDAEKIRTAQDAVDYIGKHAKGGR
jgi:hypothetical protein